MSKRHFTTVGLLAILFFSGTSFAETYKIDPVHSTAGFSIRHIVSRVNGSFTDVSGMINYDPKSPEKFSAQATIKAASINTNNGARDKHLQSPDFFDAAKYPEITFKSTKAKKKDDLLMVTGNLTMHGITKSIVLPVEILGLGVHPMSKAPVAGFAAEMTLKRSDFGVNSWTDMASVVGDEVKITLNIEGAGGKDQGNPCNPCAKGKANPCNPCNPCAKTKANPCNPCNPKGK